jgi:hypothetical protein
MGHLAAMRALWRACRLRTGSYGLHTIAFVLIWANRYVSLISLCRYGPPGSHEGLVEGLLVENRLRLRIAELQAHRAAGRRTMAEVCARHTFNRRVELVDGLNCAHAYNICVCCRVCAA